MIRRVKIVSYEAMQKLLAGNPRLLQDACVISIVMPPTPRLFQVDTQRCITLEFDDIVHGAIKTMNSRQRAKSRYFRQVHADAVIDFINANQACEKALVLYVHCMYGISRSGGIGTVVAEQLGLSMKRFAYENARIKPNDRVLSLLRWRWAAHRRQARKEAA